MWWMMVALAQAAPAGLPPGLETAYNLALGAPPGLGAQALLQLSSGVPDPALQREWLELSWKLAASAQPPAALAVFPGLEEGTRAGSTAAASALKIDRLSLAAGVARAMLPLDPQRAKAMFTAIPPPDGTVAGCEASLLPDVTPYYDALVALSPAGGDGALAMAVLGRTSSMAEMAPALRAAAAIPFPGGGLQGALDTLAGGFGKITPNPRAFRFYAPQIELAMEAAVARARKLGAGSDKLIEAYRNFLMAQFRSPHCGDSGTRFQQIVQQTAWFGEAIRGARPPLSTEGMAQVAFEGEMAVTYYWQATDVSRLRQDAQRLGPGPGAEWKQRAEELLGRLEQWRGEDEMDTFHQKALVYELLLEGLPAAGEMNAPALAAAVRFLSAPAALERSPEEWYFRARRLLARRPELAGLYRSSGHIPLMVTALLAGR